VLNGFPIRQMFFELFDAHLFKEIRPFQGLLMRLIPTIATASDVGSCLMVEK
jgi:hypothetical protein